MKRLSKLIMLVVAMVMATTVFAAEQPGKGDFAIGARYGNISTDSDFEDREGLYTAELEFFLEGGTSFGVGVSRPPESDIDPSFNVFIARNWGPAFIRGSVNYLEFRADDATTAGIGLGLSFVPKPNFRIVAMVEAAYVLGDLNFVNGFEGASGPSVESCSNSNADWCDEPPAPPMEPDVENVDLTYQAGIGIAWFK